MSTYLVRVLSSDVTREVATRVRRHVIRASGDNICAGVFGVDGVLGARLLVVARFRGAFLLVKWLQGRVLRVTGDLLAVFMHTAL